jgi:hypothetical protein
MPTTLGAISSKDLLHDRKQCHERITPNEARPLGSTPGKHVAHAKSEIAKAPWRHHRPQLAEHYRSLLLPTVLKGAFTGERRR